MTVRLHRWYFAVNFIKLFSTAILQNTYGALLLPGLILLKRQKLTSRLSFVYKMF